MKANLVVYDFHGFPERGDHDMFLRAKKLVSHMTAKETHLLVLCIPMTYTKKRFAYSPHSNILRRLGDSILSNTVIALTDANNVRTENFETKLEKWKEDITEFLEEDLELDNEILENIPIIPVYVGARNGDIPANLQPNPTDQYYWLTKFLLHAMPVTKPNGLPTLIKWNRMLLRNQTTERQDQEQQAQPRDQEQQALPQDQEQQAQPQDQEQQAHSRDQEQQAQPQDQEQQTQQEQQAEQREEHAQPLDPEQRLEFQDVETARKLITEAQCDMFSKMGLNHFEPYYGEAIGLILGENENQDW